MGNLTQYSFLTALGILLLGGGTACESQKSPHQSVKIDDLPPLPETQEKGELRRYDERATRELTLAVVGEVRGELEPCGCPTLPFGGFERRATLLENLRAKGPGPLFHLDAGDTLIKGFATKRADSVRERANEILRLSLMVGVDVWVPGPSDLVALSADVLRSVEGPKRISATWLDAEGAPWLSPATVIERDGIRLGVIGLSAAPPPDSGLQMKPPIQAARDALAGLPTDLDMVVALGSVADAQALAVAAAVDGLTAVISTRGTAYEAPTMSGEQVVVIETPDRGRYLQVIHARLGAPAFAPLLLHPDPPTWRARLAAYRRGKPDKFGEEGRGRNLALVSTIPLSGDLAAPSAVTERLNRYRHERLKQAKAQAETVDPHTPGYASSGGCVNCHTDEFARWTLTEHAQAWLSLVSRGETQNPECVACHTTGFGQPGGLGELTATGIRKFKGVQCEMCHGPLAGHPAQAAKDSAVSPSRCIGCHDEANSPDFDYKTYLRRASCQGGAPQIIPHPIAN